MEGNQSNPLAGCSREDCPVNTGGSCIEDVEFPEDCPNAIVKLEAQSKETSEEYSSLKNFSAMSLSEVATFLQEKSAATISLIGPSSSGKTTFLAVLFHRFCAHYDGFDGHRFKDSETFLALNEKLFYAGIKPKNPDAKMPRSSLDENPVFHFETISMDGTQHSSLWIDIPGEALEHGLSKSNNAWDDFRGLARSTHIMLFIDLEVLSDPRRRGVHIELGMDALSLSVKTNTWKSRALMIVFSKSDKFSQGNAEQIESAKAKIRRRFQNDFRSIDFCELHSLGIEIDRAKSVSALWRWSIGEKGVAQ